MSEIKRRVGDIVKETYRWAWPECDQCHLPAKYKVTFLLPNCRSNPASSAYNHDDCSWCSDTEMYACEKHKYTVRVDGYEPCSIFPLARFRHMAWYKVKVKES